MQKWRDGQIGPVSVERAVFPSDRDAPAVLQAPGRGRLTRRWAVLWRQGCCWRWLAAGMPGRSAARPV